MDHAPCILGGGAITALGLGAAPLVDAVRTGATALSRCPDLRGRGYEHPVIGRIPAESEAAIEQGAEADTRAWRLAIAAAREASHAPAWNQVPSGRRGLILSTTKADLAALERLRSGQGCSRLARRHIQAPLLAEDLAQSLEVQGPVHCVSAACVSGLLALQQAARAIQNHTADLVLVIGVDLVTDFVLSGFASLKSLDPRGCRPFDRDRLGLSVGEAAAAILVGSRALGTCSCWRLLGWGSSNDANHLTGPSRDGAGLALAMERALHHADVPGDTVGYLHAHGTGTPYNDAMESHAFGRIFGENTPPIGASKGLFGHTLGAAGILETLLCVRAMDTGILPGTAGLSVPDPLAPRTLLRQPRAATGVSTLLKVNCGFGGTNAAVVLGKRN